MSKKIFMGKHDCKFFEKRTHEVYPAGSITRFLPRYFSRSIQR